MNGLNPNIKTQNKTKQTISRFMTFKADCLLGSAFPEARHTTTILEKRFWQFLVKGDLIPI